MEVVSASHGALGPLLGKLTTLLTDECGRLKGVRREIRYLRSELTGMHAALKEYTKLKDPNEQVKTWISLVRELAYDTEDCLDKFVHQLGNDGDHKEFKEFFYKTARCLKTLGSRRSIADQIDDLKARMKQVKELKNCYKLEESTSSATTPHVTVDPRLHAFFAEEAQLVGIDGPRDDLVGWMLKGGGSSKHHCRVLSIVGFGGLGKTTLAKEVYKKIRGHFDCQAFMSVSQKPNIKKIIKDIIRQVTYPDGFIRDINIWDEITSITKLRELLQDKRYLVIADDIWSTSTWGAIRCAFPENNYSSRIIVTTRIVEVARSCCPSGDDHMYEMKALDYLHSKELFFKRIFGSEARCPEMMKDVSNKILKKCGGLPLAINSISGLLANKPIAKQEWEKVKKSIGSALKKNRTLEGMSIILSLSYNNLPSNLKTCLLYLSIFPEDHVIEREMLLRRWIAEGFISEEGELSQHEVAEQYFCELINKSMVQPVGINFTGMAYGCRVHDMMLELIISRSAEDNFTTVIGSEQTGLANRQGFIRRLSIHQIDQEFASVLANEDLSHVRSLTITSSSCIKHLPSLGKFEALRVLDFEECSDGVEGYIMNDMDKLFQLKCLGVKGTRISKLPPGVVKLRDLETLDIRGTRVKGLPAGIVQLLKLQHLLTYSLYKVPDGIGNMKNLRVPPHFIITRSSLDAVEELGNLTKLNELVVDLGSEVSDKYKRHGEMLLSSIRKLGACKLQLLWVYGSNVSLRFLESLSPLPSSLVIFYMRGDYYFKDIQKQIVAAALTNLRYLRINVTKLSEEGLQTLGGLVALHSLELWLKTGRSDRFIIVQDIGFPCLNKFELRTEDDGTRVTFMKGAMPKLEFLGMPFLVLRANTDGFYLGIEHLPCLRYVIVWIYHDGVTSSVCEAAAAAFRKEAGTHPNNPRVEIFGERHEEDTN